MTNLVNQPTSRPTRKMWAVIISGAVMGGIQAALAAVLPEADFQPLLQQLGPLVTALVVSLAGWLTRERAE
ncbi:MAG: hypothetical protein KDK24_21745 [Pseudooceanicola sp.]|nr:hypothetical protein [Pseudooceanicola sp.]